MNFPVVLFAAATIIIYLCKAMVVISSLDACRNSKKNFMNPDK